jgi:UDP-glucuronate 4-epimerase
MTTLITGGAGFIGSRLAARLLHLGEHVVILDNFDSYYDPAIKRSNIRSLYDVSGVSGGLGLEVVRGDVRDEGVVQTLFEQHKIERVAHLAAMSGVRYSIDHGRLYADINTSGSVTLMDAARQHDVRVFVQASTSSVYGQTAQIPFVETDAADRPLAPYPASKRAAEVFGHSYHQLFGLNVTVLRFFNVYGPHSRPDMMPIRAIESILNEQVISLYDGGTLQRDWTYVDDVINGLVMALERPLGYQIINLGYGAPTPLTEFIQIYESLIGKTAITEIVPSPASEPRITFCDNSLARRLLDFDPQTPLDEGLARTWYWYRSYHGL